MGNVDKNENPLIVEGGKENPRHLSSLKMSTSDRFLKLKTSRWFEPCVSFCERWWGPSAFGVGGS